MKKMFVAVLLASAAVMACGSKKASTTPSSQAPQGGQGQGPGQGMNGDAMGGTTYGGNKTTAPAGKDTPNPCAPK